MKLGVHGKRHNPNSSQPYGIANVVKQLLQTRGEYNTAGDSQAAVPFTIEMSVPANPCEKGNGAASLTPASSSCQLPVTQHMIRNWLNAETVKSCESVRCRPFRSATEVCQKGTVCQRMGGGNTSCGVSPHPQGARLDLGLVRQGDGSHYPVGQSLLGDSLPFLLTSVTDKELLRVTEAPGAVHVCVQRSYGTQQCQGWICLL